MNASGMSIATSQLMASHRASVVDPAAGSSLTSRTIRQPNAADNIGFSQLLRKRIADVRFSAHAATRMKSRNIELTPEMMSKLTKAVDGAADKGARDSLILLRNYAFIVNIPDRTVVTAMDGNGLKENVFTNIDSAVVAD